VRVKRRLALGGSVGLFILSEVEGQAREKQPPARGFQPRAASRTSRSATVPPHPFSRGAAIVISPARSAAQCRNSPREKQRVP